MNDGTHLPNVHEYLILAARHFFFRKPVLAVELSFSMLENIIVMHQEGIIFSCLHRCFVFCFLMKSEGSLDRRHFFEVDWEN